MTGGLLEIWSIFRWDRQMLRAALLLYAACCGFWRLKSIKYRWQRRKQQTCVYESYRLFPQMYCKYLIGMQWLVQIVMGNLRSTRTWAYRSTCCRIAQRSSVNAVNALNQLCVCGRFTSPLVASWVSLALWSQCYGLWNVWTLQSLHNGGPTNSKQLIPTKDQRDFSETHVRVGASQAAELFNSSPSIHDHKLSVDTTRLTTS